MDQSFSLPSTEHALKVKKIARGLIKAQQADKENYPEYSAKQKKKQIKQE